MAQRQNFTAILPATRCTEQMRQDVAAVAEAAKVDMADVIRDALAMTLVNMKLSLQLVVLDDLDDEVLEQMGLERQEEPDPDAPPAGCWGGVPRGE